MDPLYKIKNGIRRCPYNPNHTVQALRFISHLLKCSKKSSVKLLVCPWNATHHVYPEHYKIHLSTCESQELLDGIGEIAIPDSAHVRKYKMQKLMESDFKNEIVTAGSEVILYYEPINTNHDYQVEVYNRRFQTQELSTRDIDEFTSPVIPSLKYDLWGNVIEKGVIDTLPPGREDSGDEDNSQADGPEEVESHSEVDSESSSAPPRDASFWSGGDDPNGCVVNNRRYYYGRRINYGGSRFGGGEESGGEAADGDCLSTNTDASVSGDDVVEITLNMANQLGQPFTCLVREEASGIFLPTRGGVWAHDHEEEKRDNHTTLSTMLSSVRLAGGETGRRAVSRPPTTLAGERPTYALVPGGLQAKEENVPVSPSAVPQVREGGLKPKLVTGHGRAYRLQKLYDTFTQRNNVPGGAEAPRPSTGVGEGRGLHLQRQFDELQRGNTPG